MKTMARIVGVLVLAGCGGGGSGPGRDANGVDGGPAGGGSVYAACSSSANCSASLVCVQAFAGEPRFCGQSCNHSTECVASLGDGWECQSTDSGGICTQLCSAGSCPAPSHCRGATCQVF